MDANRFDALTRSLAATLARRSVLRGGAAALALGAARFPGVTDAKKNKKPKKPPLNAFGCVNVGQKCRGKDAKCCSGICKGKKPKKGKKDKSKCVAHNTGGCTLDRDICSNPAAAVCGTSAFCLNTTGNAPFCATNNDFALDVNCQPCGKDTDCEALGFGPGAACVILRTQGLCLTGCEGFNGSTGTACIAPGA